MLGKKIKSKTLVLFLSILLTFFSVAYLTFVWRSTVTATTDEAIKIAKVAAAAFPTEEINSLNLNETDLSKGEYQNIKSNLTNIRSVDARVRFVYLFVNRGDKIILLADSEDPKSADYSPPGQEYTEATSDYFSTLSEGTPHVTKPITDRWGTWISILIPIIDKKSGVTVSAIGMDYPAKYWNAAAIVQVVQTGSIILSLYLLFMIIYVITISNSETKENENNYKTFFDTIDDIFVVGDPTGKIHYTNRAATHILGYSPEELQSMHVLDLNPKAKRKEAEEIFKEMFAGKRSICPLPLEKKDGSLLPVETRVWFGRWDNEDCIFGISKNIGPEQELLQKFNTIFENNPSLMAISELPSRKFTDVNKTFLTTLGYTKDEVIGKTAAELNLFINPDEQQKVAEELKIRRRVHNIELQIKTKSGKIIDGIFSGEILENQGNSYYLTVMVDQTESKRIKDEILKKNTELESLNKLMVDREIRMIELKKENDSLKQK